MSVTTIKGLPFLHLLRWHSGLSMSPNPKHHPHNQKCEDNASHQSTQEDSQCDICIIPSSSRGLPICNGSNITYVITDTKSSLAVHTVLVPFPAYHQFCCTLPPSSSCCTDPSVHLTQTQPPICSRADRGHLSQVVLSSRRSCYFHAQHGHPVVVR